MKLQTSERRQDPGRGSADIKTSETGNADADELYN